MKLWRWLPEVKLTTQHHFKIFGPTFRSYLKIVCIYVTLTFKKIWWCQDLLFLSSFVYAVHVEPAGNSSRQPGATIPIVIKALIYLAGISFQTIHFTLLKIGIRPSFVQLNWPETHASLSKIWISAQCLLQMSWYLQNPFHFLIRHIISLIIFYRELSNCRRRDFWSISQMWLQIFRAFKEMLPDGKKQKMRLNRLISKSFKYVTQYILTWNTLK